MRKFHFVNNEIYHIYNRGVEKRDIFLEKLDYLRFVHDLFIFNNENELTLPSNVRFSLRTPSQIDEQYLNQCLEIGSPNIEKGKPRKLLIEILAFCLMPNHYHLLLRQKRDNGIIKFMQKLGIGYTMYFNQKYKRNGVLFQGKFKATWVNQEDYFDYILYYIHLNSLDLIEPKWREEEIKNLQKAISFLNSYRWSSHLDYIGKKNFPSVTQRDFLLNYLGGERAYKDNIINLLKEMNKTNKDKFNKNEFKILTLE